jgi:cadmium resistance protein CadD (predicted permease)
MVDDERVIAFVLVVLVALGATGLEGIAILARSAAPRATLALVGVALALAGVAAAAAMAPMPSGIIGFAGFLPLLRGFGRLTGGVRWQEDLSGTAAIQKASLTNAAVAYLPIVATRAAREVLVSSALVVVVGTLAALVMPWLGTRPATAEKLRRAGVAAAPWALMLVGGLLVVEGGAFSWLLRWRR